MSTLERAIATAAQVHAGQTDKAGEPYILHPLRVMLAQSTPEHRIVGVLHDVVEECAGWTLGRLAQEGFSPAILAAIDKLTKRDGEEYDTFGRRAATDPIAGRVKLADLFDDMDMSRIACPTERDRARIEKYRRAALLVEQTIERGRAKLP